MKKLLFLLLILASVLSFSACDPTSRPEEPFITVEPAESGKDWEESTTEPTTESPTTESTELEPGLSVEEQIALFVVNREQWIPTESYYVPISYALTDLDQNGRLELWRTVCMGTGVFSYNACWEVAPNFDGIVSCDEIFNGESSQIDMGYSTATAFYDKTSGVYYHIGTDYLREGWMHNATAKYAISLQDGQLVQELLCEMLCTNYEDGTQEINCYDINGEGITAEEFETYEYSAFSHLHSMSVTFGWQLVYEEEVNDLDADQWHRILEKSWAGFSMN